MLEYCQGGYADKPHCCFCESEDVTLIAPFGTAQLVRQYYCRSCKSVFEFIRWQQKIPTDKKV